MKLAVLIISIILCNCEDTTQKPLLQAGIGSLLRPAQDYPLGSYAILGYSQTICEYEASMNHYWDFEPDDADDDYLDRANVDALEANSATVIAYVASESFAADRIPFSQWNGVGGQKSWILDVTNAPSLEAGFVRDNCALNDLATVNDAGMGAGVEVLLAITYDYSGNPGAGDSTLKGWIIRAGSTLSNTVATAVGPSADCTADLVIGAVDGNILHFDGKIYWVAYYDTVLLQADLEALFAGTVHPACDYDPLFYVDFHQDVGANYTPEIGAAWVLTVHGTPVKGP